MSIVILDEVKNPSLQPLRILHLVQDVNLYFFFPLKQDEQGLRSCGVAAREEGVSHYL